MAVEVAAGQTQTIQVGLMCGGGQEEETGVTVAHREDADPIGAQGTAVEGAAQVLEVQRLATAAFSPQRFQPWPRESSS